MNSLIRIARKIAIDLDPLPTEEEVRDINDILQGVKPHKKPYNPRRDKEDAIIKSNYTKDKADIWYTNDITPREGEAPMPDTLETQKYLDLEDTNAVFLVSFPDADFIVEAPWDGREETQGFLYDVEGKRQLLRNYTDDYLYDFGESWGVDIQLLKNLGSVTTNKNMMDRLNQHGLGRQLLDAGEWLKHLRLRNNYLGLIRTD